MTMTAQLITLDEINSNPIYQPPADWLEEEVEYILFHTPEQEETKRLLLIELKTRMKYRKSNYKFNKKDPQHPCARPLKECNERYNMLEYDTFKWDKTRNRYDWDSHQVVKEKGLCNSEYIATWKGMRDIHPNKIYFKCRFADCDFSVKDLKRALFMNKIHTNWYNYTKKDLIRLYMKM